MERLIQIVKEERRNHEELFSKMAEDYIAKASEVLKKYVTRPQNDGYRFLAVEVKDINFSDGTVKVGSVWSSIDSSPDKDNVFNKAENYIGSGEDVLESSLLPEEVSPFIEQLKKRGFKYVMYMEDTNFDGLRGLYPFFEI